MTTYRVGDIVQIGSATPGNVYGVVTAAGPKRINITWENGLRQSVSKDRWQIVKRVPDDAREEALHATRRVRAELLAKLTDKNEAQLRRSGELRAYTAEPDGTVRPVKP
jgi:hypothetical protein